MSTPRHSVLAFGAYLKNRIGWWDGERLHGSALHGDLGSAQACTALQASASALVQQCQASGQRLEAVAHDLHPDFHSTECALQWAERLQLPALAVQHHHAHLAGVACTQGLSGPVLGWALDGFGLGSDGQAWGGELLWVHGAQWRRLARLQPIALPGGDRAAREPWRLALAYAHAIGHQSAEPEPDAPGIASVAPARRQAVQALLARGLHCPPSSSAGRWFDAVAALLGLCLQQDDEAQAPLALQAQALQALTDPASAPERVRDDWLLAHGNGPPDATELPVSRLVQQVLQLAPTQGLAMAALHFHWGLADGLARVLAHWHAALQDSPAQPLPQVCLSGGCFFNPLLRERLRWQLEKQGLTVHLHEPDGHGDAHLAWGQAWVAQDWLRRTRTAPDFAMARCGPLSDESWTGRTRPNKKEMH